MTWAARAYQSDRRGGYMPSVPQPRGADRVAPVRSAPPWEGKYKCVRDAWSMRYRTQELSLCAARFCVSRYATTWLGTVAHEAVRFAANYTVAPAYSRFETSAIEDGDTASLITNQPGILQTGSLV